MVRVHIHTWTNCKLRKYVSDSFVHWNMCTLRLRQVLVQASICFIGNDWSTNNENDQIQNFLQWVFWLHFSPLNTKALLNNDIMDPFKILFTLLTSALKENYLVTLMIIYLRLRISFTLKQHAVKAIIPKITSPIMKHKANPWSNSHLAAWHCW